MKPIIPTFKIAESARRFVSELSFDSERYAGYLHNRGATSEEIQKLDLVLDDSIMSLASHGVYKSRDRDDELSRHLISFSPSMLSRDFRKQGRLLRHETEHFIYDLQHPNHIRNRTRIVVGSTAVSGVFGGIIGARMGMDMSDSLPLAAQVPIDVITATAGTLGGAVLGLVPASTAHIAFGPSEIQAQYAERRRRIELPDGVMQVYFG